MATYTAITPQPHPLDKWLMPMSREERLSGRELAFFGFGCVRPDRCSEPNF